MIIPSINIQNGQAVQLVGVKDFAVEAGDPITIAEQFSLVGEIAVIDLDAEMRRGNNSEIIKEIVRRFRCRVGGGIRTVEKAIEWLDEGASKVIIGTPAKAELLSQLPRERLIAALDSVNGMVVAQVWHKETGQDVFDQIETLNPYVGGFLITFIETEGRHTGIDIKQAAKIVSRTNNKVTIAGGIKNTKEIAKLDSLGADTQVSMSLNTNLFSLAEGFAAPLISDRPDGLWPTVVVDECGTALGLAWSNLKSLSCAIRNHSGIYWSRKRGLWEKGATSGSTQQLIRVDLDCDRDTLRFVVLQQGTGFCHNDTRTCWGEDWGITNLARKIEQRRLLSPLGSYTKRLFEEPGLLSKKLIEEAMELGKANSCEEIAQESADVLYFTICHMVKNGVDFEQVISVLDKRALKITRRPGNAKW